MTSHPLTSNQLAWVIAFISSIVAAANDSFQNFAWYSLVYMLCCIVGVFVVVASNTSTTYHVAIVGFLAAGIVMTSSSVDGLIYSSNGAKNAAAAGHILLAMVAVGYSYIMKLYRMLTQILDCLGVLLWIYSICRISCLS